MDPSDVERTYNMRKQQTRFYWFCSGELMESATTHAPVHQLKRFSAFHQTPIFLKDQNMKNINPNLCQIMYINGFNASKTIINTLCTSGMDIFCPPDPHIVYTLDAYLCNICRRKLYHIDHIENLRYLKKRKREF